MTRAHATRNREEDRVIGLIDRARKPAPRPRTDDEREFVTEVEATLARWVAQVGSAEVGAVVGARIGKLSAPVPVLRPRAVAEAAWSGRAEGDVPSAGMEP